MKSFVTSQSLLCPIKPTHSVEGTPHTFPPFEESEILEKLNLIPGSFVDDYSQTRNFIWSCCSADSSNIVTKCREVCKRNDKYFTDPTWFDQIVDLYSPGHFTLGTALKMAKDADPSEYLRISRRYEVRKFKFSQSFFTHFGLAEAFYTLYGDYYMFQDNIFYFFDGTIWQSQNIMANISEKLSKEFYEILHNRIVHLKSLEGQEGGPSTGYMKLLLMLQSGKHKPMMIKELQTILAKRKPHAEFDVNKDLKYSLNFSNGILDLSKLTLDSEGKITNLSEVFRPRTPTDLVSQALPYPFHVNRHELTSQISKVHNIFQTINPSPDILDFTYMWAAYNMIGDTRKQLFLVNVGHSASNGKSTEVKIHNICLSIYSVKLDKNTFNEGYSKAHKQFIHLKGNPIRHVYLEEISRSKIDQDLLKDFVDGRNINVEIMYGTSENIPLQAKVTICSNYDPNFGNTDQGTLRRGLYKKYTQRFVTAEEYNKLENKDNYHIVDHSIIDTFGEDDLLKNAYIHLLLSYAVKVINGTIQVPMGMKDHFKRVNQDYDLFANAFDELYDRTDNDEDRIYKDEFLYEMKQKLHNPKLTWNQCLSELKRINIEYDRTKRVKGNKGAICKVVKRFNGGANDQIDVIEL